MAYCKTELAPVNVPTMLKFNAAFTISRVVGIYPWTVVFNPQAIVSILFIFCGCSGNWTSNAACNIKCEMKMKQLYHPFTIKPAL